MRPFWRKNEKGNGLEGLLTVRMWRHFGKGARFGEKIGGIQKVFFYENVA
jgi:hypothetical protein